MSSIFDIEIIIIIILFFIPGFLSLQVWSLIVPQVGKKASEYVLEAISYSCLNYAVASGVIFIILNSSNIKKAWIFFFSVLILFVLPVLWPILLSKIRKLKLLKKYTLNMNPTSWDGFFSKRDESFVLIHLKNGELIGGLYSNSSYVSAYPNKKDIYLEETWQVTERGEFMHKIEGTNGLWVNKEEFSYLEFFEVVRENN